jgi:hypothetical protein
MSSKDQFFLLLRNTLNEFPKELVQILVEYYWFAYELTLINHSEVVIHEAAKFRLDFLQIRETSPSTYLGFVASDAFENGNLNWKVEIDRQCPESAEGIIYYVGMCQIYPDMPKSRHYDDIYDISVLKAQYYFAHNTVDKNYHRAHEFKVDLETNELYVKSLDETWSKQISFDKNHQPLRNWAPYIGFRQPYTKNDKYHCDIYFKSW